MRVDDIEFSQILNYCKLLAKNVDQLTQYVMLLNYLFYVMEEN